MKSRRIVFLVCRSIPKSLANGLSGFWNFEGVGILRLGFSVNPGLEHPRTKPPQDPAALRVQDLEFQGSCWSSSLQDKRQA